MSQFNLFLQPGARSESKGGLQTIENPRAVENIVFQTRSGPLDPFEERLADALMAAFGGGAQEIGEVVRALNTAGSRDRAGVAWTEQSFEAQMAKSAAMLFAVPQGAA